MRRTSDTPWWQPSQPVSRFQVVERRNTPALFVMAIVIALVAGGIGATIGRNSSTNLGTNFVDTKNTKGSLSKAMILFDQEGRAGGKGHGRKCFPPSVCGPFVFPYFFSLFEF